jgi:hypothetical protein
MIYIHTTNGKVLRKVSAPDDEAAMNCGSEEAFLLSTDVSASDLTHYVQDGQLVQMPAQPSPNHVFDYTIKDWVLDESIAITAALQQRSRLLVASDWTQLPDVPLATKEAWATYRQALRDITDQEGYPLNINWPLMPG